MQRAEAKAQADALADVLAARARADVAFVARHVQSVNVSNPLPGADAVYEIDGDAIARPLAVIATLTAAAGGAARSVFVEYRDSTGTAFALAGSSATVSPGTTQRFSFWPGAGYPTWPVNNAAVASMPDTPLDGGESLAVRVDQLAAGDQLSGIVVRLEVEWRTPPLDSAAS
jgi:hypothetical protein